MSAITIHAMDIVFERPLSVSLAYEGDRAPGMPLLGFIIAIALSIPLWALIGLTAWTLLT